MRLPRKDTEERDSRIAHGKPALILGVILVGAGIVHAFVKGDGLSIAVLVSGVLVCALWLLFPYLRGRIELSLGGGSFRFLLRGDLTDPVPPPAASSDAQEGLPPPAEEQQPPRRFRKLIPRRLRNRGSAEG
jgi:hypothetical protein